jgi:hypothetical protein
MIFTPQFAAKKKKEEAEEPEAEQEAVYYAQKKDEPPRLIGICGDLDEEKAGELLYGMISPVQHKRCSGCTISCA